MYFQRFGAPVVGSAVLHVTSASNPPAHFQLAGLTSPGLPTFKSSNSGIQVVNVRRTGNVCDFDIRVGPVCLAGHAMLYATTANNAATSASLTITVQAALQLPERFCNEGALSRLLLSEARGPSSGNYVAADSLTSMQWMQCVVENRLANNPAQFAAPGAKTWIDIIKAPGQFAGFSSYPQSYSSAGNVQSVLDIANTDSNKRQPAFHDFAQNAINVASARVCPLDPCPSKLYGWRTAETGSPGPRFVEYRTLAGNTFFTLRR